MGRSSENDELKTMMANVQAGAADGGGPLGIGQFLR